MKIITGIIQLLKVFTSTFKLPYLIGYNLSCKGLTLYYPYPYLADKETGTYSLSPLWPHWVFEPLFFLLPYSTFRIQGGEVNLGSR